MRTRSAGALASVVAALLLTAPPALADPPPSPPGDPPPPAETAPAPSSTTLSLPDLGTAGTISFGRLNRENASTSLTIPVPSGLVPLELRAKIELPINLRYGNLAVSQGDRLISRIGLPPQDGAEVVVPLAGVQPAGGAVTLGLRMVTVAVEPYCWVNEAPIRLSSAAIVFAGGEEPPRSVAEFMPPALRRVTIAIPANPSVAESNAAIKVVTAVANRNGQKMDVAIVPIPAGRPAVDLPPAPLEREIVVRESPDKGLSLLGGAGMPTLLVSGTGDDLVAQAQLLTSDVFRFAASTKAAAGPLLEDQLLGSDTTLQEMNNSGLSAPNSVAIDLNQTRFGVPLRDVRVHLIGSYTPLPDNIGGEVTASVGGEVIDRWPTGPDGAIDRTVSVPDRMLRRVTSIQVGVRFTGDQGDCRFAPTVVRLDGTTEIKASSANPPVPEGFQSIPQALMPSIQIGIGSDAFADTVRAARIMAGFQRASALPLLTRVMSLKEAIESGGSAVLIASSGWDDPSLMLPFRVNAGEVTVQGVDIKGQPASMDLDPESKFGSLQTVFEGSRSFLVATSNGAPVQLDRLLDWLSAERGRWSDLDGQAVVAAQTGEPVIIANPPVAGPPASPTAILTQRNKWSWPVIGGIGTLLALVAAAIALRRRRAR